MFIIINDNDGREMFRIAVTREPSLEFVEALVAFLNKSEVKKK